MEEITQLLNQFNWPGAFAVVGSVVTIVIGLLTYLYNIHVTPKDDEFGRDIKDLYERLDNLSSNYDMIARLIDENKNLSNDGDISLRDSVRDAAADLKVLKHSIVTLQTNQTHFESRIQDDMKQYNEKLNKLTDIILKMLSEDLV